MKRYLKRPRNPLLVALPWALAAAAAAGCYVLVRELDVEPLDLKEVLPTLALRTAYVEAQERGWIADVFPEQYLAAPVSDLPCASGIQAARPLTLRISEALAWVEEGRLDDAVAELGELDRENPANWVPALALGMVLARAGRLAEAEAALASLYERRTMQATVQQAIEAAARGRPYSGPPTEEVRGAIHLLHAYGYVLIETHRGGDELWPVLRGPIGCSKLLALRGATDRMRRLPTWAEHRLAAPGCGLTEHSLTTLDLYNDLIVGYLEHPDFRSEPGRRQRELARADDDPPHENPLLAVMRAVAADFPSERFPAEREHWLWALSNAERLLEQRRESSAEEIGNVRLAYNLAALMESALPASPPPAREALRRRKNALLAVAFAGRAGVLPRQRPALALGLARLELLEAVRSGTFKAPPEELLSDLDGRQTEVVKALEVALAQRRDAEKWLAHVDAPGAVIRQALGQRTAAWLAASRRDFSATLALAAAGQPPEKRPWWARWARGVLEPPDRKPAELAALEKEIGFWWRVSPNRLLTSPPAAAMLAALAGALTWIAGTWLAVQLARRRDLVTSFYRLEARARLGRRT